MDLHLMKKLFKIEHNSKGNWMDFIKNKVKLEERPEE